MAQPYIGEIRMFAGNFAPEGWQLCSGQLLSIAENTTLFQVIGTTYGGDGVDTFQLPDLQCRVPVHQGGGLVLGSNGGVENVTLTTSQMPAHSHALSGTTSPANDANATSNLLAQTSTFKGFQVTLPPTAAMAAQSLGMSGGNQPHDNMQPYLCINFIISLYGIYPSQT